MKLIVGLGNPGKEYEFTRHNVGFLVLDNYLGNVKWDISKDACTYLTSIEGEKVCFLKPLTYMNLSGYAVSRVMNYYKVDLENILVIQDDLDLKPCTFKLKKASSHGGHNGIRSIIEQLGTNNFARLKVGIGNDKKKDTASYVLNKLPKEVIENINSEVYKEIINSFIKDGIQKTMNIYNTK